MTVDGVNGGSPSFPTDNIKIDGEKATKQEFVNSVLAFTQKAGKVVLPQQCVGGKMPDGAVFAVCKDGTYIQRANQDGMEMTLIQGDKVSYAKANSTGFSSGCTDKDGNKCE